MMPDLDHIGIAVDNLQDVIENLKKMFGTEPDFLEEVQDQKVRIAGYKTGNSITEYFEPTSPDSPIAKFLEKRGNGIHHIAMRVENIDKTLSDLKVKGYQLIDEKPRLGAAGKKIAFVHPKSTNGILIELCQI
jgi:methylmalonyl-CoA/ethylmalonyl-CoA epimerase